MKVAGCVRLQVEDISEATTITMLNQQPVIHGFNHYPPKEDV
jgi:hypothetical protein